VRLFPPESIRYWRTIGKAEVDFVLEVGEEVLPIEVKYRPMERPKVSRGLRSFITTYKPKRALVVTRDFFGRQLVDGTQILFVPAYCL